MQRRHSKRLPVRFPGLRPAMLLFRAATMLSAKYPRPPLACSASQSLHSLMSFPSGADLIMAFRSLLIFISADISYRNLPRERRETIN